MVSALSGGSDYSGSHAWLVQGDLRLDITADQFDRELPAVWVTQSGHPWYSRWRVVSTYLSRMDDYAPDDLPYLSDFRKLKALASG